MYYYASKKDMYFSSLFKNVINIRLGLKKRKNKTLPIIFKKKQFPIITIKLRIITVQHNFISNGDFYSSIYYMKKLVNCFDLNDNTFELFKKLYNRIYHADLKRLLLHALGCLFLACKIEEGNDTPYGIDLIRQLEKYTVHEKIKLRELYDIEMKLFVLLNGEVYK